MEFEEGRLNVLTYGVSGMGGYALWFFGMEGAWGGLCAGGSGQGRHG